MPTSASVTPDSVARLLLNHKIPLHVLINPFLTAFLPVIIDAISFFFVFAGRARICVSLRNSAYMHACLHICMLACIYADCLHACMRTRIA